MSRTKDVIVEGDVSFRYFSLSKKLVRGLEKNGFSKPSPIQYKAIPLGKYGFDLIVKAKSGTGKTLVFGIVALECLKPDFNAPQVVILAPTREIAVQIKKVISDIANQIENVQISEFIGGLSIEQDRKVLRTSSCQIVIGAPGRISTLIRTGCLRTEHVKLLVLDEADKLMDETFQKDILDIFNSLPTKKQVIVTSATYPNNLSKVLEKFMKSAVHVSLEPDPTDESQFAELLYGVQQFVSVVRSHANTTAQVNYKIDNLTEMLSKIAFSQAIVFFNYQTRTEFVTRHLTEQKWPVRSISAMIDQPTRLAILDDFRNNKFRILLCTDLIARGIDLINVDLVINFDIAYDSPTYLHRMGRSGRFGSYGICVSIVNDDEEQKTFLEKILYPIAGLGRIPKIPNLDEKSIWDCNAGQLEHLFVKEVEVKEKVVSNAKQLNGFESGKREKTVDRNFEKENAIGAISKLHLHAADDCQSDELFKSVQWILNDANSTVDPSPVDYRVQQHFKYSNDRDYPNDIVIQAFDYAIGNSDVHWNVFMKDKIEPMLCPSTRDNAHNKKTKKNRREQMPQLPRPNCDSDRLENRIEPDEYYDYFKSFYENFGEIRPSFETVGDYAKWRTDWTEYLSVCTEFVRQTEYRTLLNNSAD